MTDAQTTTVHKNGICFPSGRDGVWLKTVLFIVLLSPYTPQTCYVLLNSCGKEVYSKQCLVQTWNLVCSIKRDSHKVKDSSVSHSLKLSIPLHSNKRWRKRREKTIGLCDSSGERRLRVKDSTRPVMKTQHCHLRPFRQILYQFQLPWHVLPLHQRASCF